MTYVKVSPCLRFVTVISNGSIEHYDRLYYHPGIPFEEFMDIIKEKHKYQ
jgi:hypothetical protein